MDRNELLSTYTEYLLSPPIPESPEKAEGGAIGGMSAEEWEFRKQELELKRQKEQRYTGFVLLISEFWQCGSLERLCLANS